MKIAILGTGFGKEHTKLFCQEKLVDKIVVGASTKVFQDIIDRTRS